MCRVLQNAISKSRSHKNEVNTNMTNVYIFRCFDLNYTYLRTVTPKVDVYQHVIFIQRPIWPYITDF